MRPTCWHFPLAASSRNGDRRQGINRRLGRVLSASIVIDMPLNKWRFMHPVLKGASEHVEPTPCAGVCGVSHTCRDHTWARSRGASRSHRTYGYKRQPLPPDVSFVLCASSAGRASIRRARS
jgi:hypothetical protein